MSAFIHYHFWGSLIEHLGGDHPSRATLLYTNEVVNSIYNSLAKSKPSYTITNLLCRHLVVKSIMISLS